MRLNDARKEYIISTATNFFGLKDTDQSAQLLAQSQAVDTFLDDRSCSILTAFLTKNQGLEFLNHVGKCTDKEDGFLVFIKVHPCVIDSENIHSSILVSSIFGSPAATLYYSLHNLFVPNILENQKNESFIDEKLQNLLKELEAGLGSWLRKDFSRVARNKNGSIDEENVSTVFTPNDEFQFWEDISISERDHKAKIRAAAFLNIFQTGLNHWLF